MISFTESQLLAWMGQFLWPFFRILAFMSVAPFFSSRNIPNRTKLGLALFLASLVGLMEGGGTARSLSFDASSDWLLLLIQQLYLGLAIGFAAKVVFSAFEMAGEFIGLQMGLNFAVFFDPSTSGQASVVGRLFSQMALLSFLALGGHLFLLQGLLDSFAAFPIGQGISDLMQRLGLVRLGAEIFKIGFFIALPVVAMILMANLTLGIVSRIAPQINIFSLGFPVMLMVGLLGIWMVMPDLQFFLIELLGRHLLAWTQ